MKKLLILLILSYLGFANEIEFQIPLIIIDNNKTNQIKENNLSIKNKEINTSNLENNSTHNETNKIIETVEEIDEEFISQTPIISFALIIDKKKFFQFLPSLINSINAYLIQKKIDFNLSIYNNDVNISSLPQKYIIDIETNKSKIETFKDYNKTFLYLYLIKMTLIQHYQTFILED
jgi:hypothetical protein